MVRLGHLHFSKLPKSCHHAADPHHQQSAHCPSAPAAKQQLPAYLNQLHQASWVRFPGKKVLLWYIIRQRRAPSAAMRLTAIDAAHRASEASAGWYWKQKFWLLLKSRGKQTLSSLDTSLQAHIFAPVGHCKGSWHDQLCTRLAASCPHHGE